MPRMSVVRKHFFILFTLPCKNAANEKKGMQIQDVRGSSKGALSVGTARYSRVNGPRSTKEAQWLECATDDRKV